ncbi:MAG TPA: L-histidine N(alpha)-methyltransferase [Candidatus Saccharimonadales bacterium]|nr:L-histidine N(alpha)-methyltransferase [Candidatus Saccharimonadales bacterium]
MRKTITPDDELYQLYSTAELENLIANLRLHHEIPLQYSYFGKGAQSWDAYAKRMTDEGTTNIITVGAQLLALNDAYVEGLLAGYKKVNVIDITIGNAMPVRPFLQQLLDMQKQVTYTGLDFSPDILAIVKNNIQMWFKGKIPFTGHRIDINYDRFDQIICNNDPDAINIILYFGGMASNFKTPATSFRIIHDSLGERDLFMYDDKLDTPVSRKFFDFNPEPINQSVTQILSPRHQWLLDILNIDPSLYEVEMTFDHKAFERRIQVKLKEDICVYFSFNGVRKSADLDKHDTILLVRVTHNSAQDIYELLDKTGFDLLHASHTPDTQYLLSISRIKRS